MTLQMCEEAVMAAIALRASRRQSDTRQAAALRPLDPDVVSAAIPAFFIGQNRAGLWVARDANGRVGGLFLFKSSAVDFARRQSAPARCALVFPSETFELDIENRGNPLILLAQRARWLFARSATSAADK
ncbi:hypothetical protein A5906_23170 [Bradyrhizobium sacchari]|uniref:Uncharacterized protein n=1 Tax=Bradyrhizobium sacchari TaxID=1399419 RepID=A0A560JSJ1_9BRAD|nr:hypothetical protein [Bradyrhizobium sacchari]OPZ00123.1 hypothetical protein A5906_23170 [Bradyrhizobium sacchari]TWB60105.1 hypothetical protein FBZ94_104329 [Bradyrhizobium sacchari]TWB74085.1 hypothetical protein FBZ95_105336 [Bradyrhizobium sacchari]